MPDRNSMLFKEISKETENLEFEFNKIRNEITNLRNETTTLRDEVTSLKDEASNANSSAVWEEFVAGPLVTSRVKTYLRNGLFDLENYDYRIDVILNVNTSNGSARNTINIQTYLLDENNNRLKFANHWGRTHVDENCDPSGVVERSVTTWGYVKSQYNETVVCYGLDGNDGEDGMRMIMDLIPSYTSSGVRSLIYTADLASNSILRQQFSNYRGTLVDTNGSLKNVKGIELFNNNSMVYVPELCYLRVYRRNGGYNKFEK